MTSKPRSNVFARACAIARTRTSPGATLGAGVIRNRTVLDSSGLVNATDCWTGAADQPAGSSSFTVLSAAPGVSLTTVTRISRVAAGRPAAAGRTDAAGIMGISGDTLTQNA